MIWTPKPICRHPLENTVTVTLSTKTESTMYRDEKQQYQTVKHILKLKRFTDKQISNIQKPIRFKPPQDKLYIGKVEHDGATNIHGSQLPPRCVQGLRPGP